MKHRVRDITIQVLILTPSVIIHSPSNKSQQVSFTVYFFYCIQLFDSELHGDASACSSYCPTSSCVSLTFAICQRVGINIQQKHTLVFLSPDMTSWHDINTRNEFVSEVRRPQQHSCIQFTFHSAQQIPAVWNDLPCQLRDKNISR